VVTENQTNKQTKKEIRKARRMVERLFFIEILSFDWNCPKYITPRYTAAEVEEVVTPLRQRIAELEAQLILG
jgi:uncharacterized protein